MARAGQSFESQENEQSPWTGRINILLRIISAIRTESGRRSSLQRHMMQICSMHVFTRDRGSKTLKPRDATVVTGTYLERTLFSYDEPLPPIHLVILN